MCDGLPSEPSALLFACRFIDTDRSGVLDRDELKDGFVAMGVDIEDNVAEEFMDLLDADGNGTVVRQPGVAHVFC